MIPIKELINFCMVKTCDENLTHYDFTHYNEIIDTLTILIGEIPRTYAFWDHDIKALKLKKERNIKLINHKKYLKRKLLLNHKITKSLNHQI